jgi:hypothetical protein
MSNDLINTPEPQSSIALSTIYDKTGITAPEYKKMLTHIETHLPAIQRDSKNFYKSHSQFMGVTLDVTAITPIRRVKHVLAELDRTRGALEEAYINRTKKEIELRRKQRELDNWDNPTDMDGFGLSTRNEFDRELLEIEVLEIQVQLKNMTNAVEGAIRKMSFFTTQYANLLKSIGKDHITEEEYEIEEDKYHIMTAMKQALCAARARGGMIDEGNQIYLFDMGINGAAAQREVYAFMQMEEQLMSQGMEPTYEHVMLWLEACAAKFAGCARRNAENRGYQLLDLDSVVKRERVNDDLKGA